jgi:hypothetical protein
LLRELFIDEPDPVHEFIHTTIILALLASTYSLSYAFHFVLPFLAQFPPPSVSSQAVVTAASASPKARCLPVVKSTTSSFSPSPAQWRFPNLSSRSARPTTPSPSAARSAVIMHRRTQPSSRRFPLPILLPRPCVLFPFAAFIPSPLALLLACEHPLRVRQALSLGFSPAFGFPFFYTWLSLYFQDAF